jgi:hypothetical protein
MTDELVRVSKDEETARMVANARTLISLYPQAVLVDPLEAQALTIDRESMHIFFGKINALPEGSFGIFKPSHHMEEIETWESCISTLFVWFEPLTYDDHLLTLLCYSSCRFLKKCILDALEDCL